MSSELHPCFFALTDARFPSFADPDMALRFSNLGPGHQEPDAQSLEDLQLDSTFEPDDTLSDDSSGEEDATRRGSASPPSVELDVDGDGFGYKNATQLPDSDSDNGQSNEGDLDAYEHAYDRDDD